VISEDPLFEDYVNNNYFLTLNSPCIGTGENGIDMGRYPYQELLIGDLNGDLSINILDIILTVDLVLNTNYSLLADINLDLSIDVLDIVLMVGLILDV